VKIYNSQSKLKQDFKPINPGKVSLYVCGNTVYDHCHIGHARSSVVFDMVARTFEAFNYDVTLVRNITDIDDKIINRAIENNESTSSLTNRIINSMHQDEKSIAVRDVQHEPRATEYLAEMISLIELLISKKHAYVAPNNDVYFSVKSFDRYGELTSRSVDDLLSGARVDIDLEKQDPLDFAMWKHAKPGEPSWDSPWGKGRPGWHIECSAMAHSLLGNTIDIHGGGMDLKFPHHENEKAQTEAAYNCVFANCWMHVGLLTINNEKMSKSLGNSVTIPEFLANHNFEVLRHFMLSSHYRSPVNYSVDSIKNSQLALERLYTAIRGLDVVAPMPTHELKQAFFAAMSDDFHTPQAFSVLFDMAREINRLKSVGQIEDAAKMAALLCECGYILGIMQQDADDFLQKGCTQDESDHINQLVNDRMLARANKDWARADALRAELDSIGVVLDDTKDGTTWRLL